MGPRRTYGPLEALEGEELVAFHRRQDGGPTGAPLVVSWLELVEGVG